MTNKRFLSFILAILALLLLFGLSSVSSGSYDLTDSNSTAEFQNIIDTDTDTDLVINLDEGNYAFSQINVNRSVVIQGKNKNTRIAGSGTGTLFNVTAANVTIINLTITSYQTAVSSNSSGLKIIDNDITTSDISINVSSTGGDLKGILIENNKIVSSVSNWNYGAVYISAPFDSGATIEVSWIGNNITADSASNSNGVCFYAPECVSNLTFENNNITVTNDGVYLSAYSSNNTNITFTNNNITGAYGAGVYLDASSSNNTNITFTNNNITGVYGVSLSAYSNINITFTNNNITGAYGPGVSLSAYSNTNITFTNNNITGAYSCGVFLDASSSNNTNITFTNNNITGIDGSGVYLHASSSNNTNITFANNNITGIDGSGVYLYASSSNNTNITFANSNISGTYDGVFLVAFSSNNTNITFGSNSIHGGQHAMYIYSYERFGGFGSGLYLLNNNFTSDDIGLYFFLDGASVRDVFVIGNNIIAVNKGIGFEEYSRNGDPNSVNSTVNYNRILADVGLDFTTTDDGSNFDYNWWGINDISGKIIGFDTNNHYILNITNLTSLADVSPDDKVTFALLVLNTTLTNDGVENLPYFVINGTFNGVAYDTSRDDLFGYEFTVLNEGLQTIDASLDDEYVALEFNASKTNVSSTIVVPDDVRVGKTINITGVLTDDDGNSIVNADINVTVDGNVYTVRTGSDGRWTFSYKPEHTGTVAVSVAWTGNNRYSGFSNASSFNVGKGNVNINITVTENPDGSITIIANVTDEDGDPVSDYSVDFILDNKAIGTKITNENGIAILIVSANKITNGTHTITVIVDGGETYYSATASVEFTRIVQEDVTPKTNKTNKTSNNPVATATMKNTGMSIIAILLVLLNVLRISIRKKQK